MLFHQPEYMIHCTTLAVSITIYQRILLGDDKIQWKI